MVLGSLVVWSGRPARLLSASVFGRMGCRVGLGTCLVDDSVLCVVRSSLVLLLMFRCHGVRPFPVRHGVGGVSDGCARAGPWNGDQAPRSGGPACKGRSGIGAHYLRGDVPPKATAPPAAGYLRRQTWRGSRRCALRPRSASRWCPGARGFFRLVILLNFSQSKNSLYCWVSVDDNKCIIFFPNHHQANRRPSSCRCPKRLARQRERIVCQAFFGSVFDTCVLGV